MKKLKIKLLFSIFLILLTPFIIKLNKPIISKYKDETIIYGTVIECQSNHIVINGKEKVLINHYDDKYKCKLGTKVLVKGKLIKPEKNTVFYLFNYKKYLLSQKIIYIFKSSNIKVINSKISLKYKVKNNIINHIKHYKSHSYLKAFIVGDKKEIDENIKDSYQNNGITHILSISGMHISIISSVLLYILNKIIKNKKTSYIIITYFLIFYLFITDFIPSIIRATTLFIITNIKKYLNIKINTIYIFILMLLILLNINPYYIYSLGFTLSFVISFYLILFNKIINRYQNYLIKIFVISVISFISSLPLIINSFFKINLLSPIINIIFIPLITFIIYPLCLITFFIKQLDPLLYKLITIIEIISLKIEKINFLNITLPHMNAIIIITYYIVITLIFKTWQTQNQKPLWIIAILIIIHKNIFFLNPHTSLTMIDVGQGDSLLIKLKNSKGNILIDTGGKINDGNNKISKKIIIPYLRAEGIDKLDYLILTHGDYDHMGEAIKLINNFKVEKVIFNCGHYNDLEKELIKVLDKKKIKYYSCIKELNIDKNKLQFLHTKEYDNENDNSNVIYTKLNSYKFMFMGDASTTTEHEILSKYNLTDIDVLKVGHHGSKTSSSKGFIDEINPKYSIISVGKNNRYGHPNKEALNNLKNTKIYRTDKQGSIMFKINNKLKIKTCRP